MKNMKCTDVDLVKPFEICTFDLVLKIFLAHLILELCQECLFSDIEKKLELLSYLNETC